jgi:hypothetical protein
MYPCCEYMVHSTPFHLFTLTPYLPPSIFRQLSIHILISSTSQMLYIKILMLHHSPFLSFLPQVPLLQTCSTYKFIYDHVCFYVYVVLLDLSST